MPIPDDIKAQADLDQAAIQNEASPVVEEKQVVEEPVVEAPIVEDVVEEVVEEAPTDRPRKNWEAEQARKDAEVERLRLQVAELREQAYAPKKEQSAEEMLRHMSDRELMAYRNNQQYGEHHGMIDSIMEERRFDRYTKRKEQDRLRLDAEIQRQKQYPETMNPAHPMAVRMTEILHENHLDNSPKGRLIAAQLASIEYEKQKAEAKGRKTEQVRQVDVKNQMGSGASRPAPKPSEIAKLEAIKQKAMQGDPEARAQWFKIRGLI